MIPQRVDESHNYLVTEITHDGRSSKTLQLVRFVASPHAVAIASANHSDSPDLL